MKLRFISFAAGFFAVLTAHASAQAVQHPCPAITGSDTFDSVSNRAGDPLYGGSWSNANGSRATMTRILKAPAMIKGIYVGAAGSDVTTAGSRILILLKGPSGNQYVALDTREAAINRDFSGRSTQRTVLQSPTITFPPFETKEIRIVMTGNGWFLFQRAMLFVEGCTA